MQLVGVPTGGHPGYGTGLGVSTVDWMKISPGGLVLGPSLDWPRHGTSLDQHVDVGVGVPNESDKRARSFVPDPKKKGCSTNSCAFRDFGLGSTRNPLEPLNHWIPIRHHLYSPAEAHMESQNHWVVEKKVFHGSILRFYVSLRRSKPVKILPMFLMSRLRSTNAGPNLPLRAQALRSLFGGRRLGSERRTQAVCTIRGCCRECKEGVWLKTRM